MDKFQTFDADIIVIGSGIGTQAFMHQFKNPESKILVLEGVARFSVVYFGWND